MGLIKHTLVSLMLAAIILLTIGTAAADDLISDSRRSLQQLVVQNPAATRCRSKAVAVLVFPEVVKAGFIFGAQEGQGIFSCTADPTAAAGS
jgi:lipid-binding SYLF domain-containing protein